MADRRREGIVPDQDSPRQLSDRPFIPILKGKQGERLALRDLNPAVRARLTPVIQMLPGRDLDTIGRECRQLARGWPDGSPVIIDALWVDPSSLPRHPLSVVSAAATGERLTVMPAVPDSSDAGYVAAARTMARDHRAGAAIRLRPASWESGQTGPLLASLLNGLGLDPPAIDLILDAGAILDPASLAIHRRRLDRALPAMPFLADWRRVVVAGGSMPSDLAAFPRGTLGRTVRHEWTLWQGAPAVGRPVGYGDYGVANPDAVDEISNPRAIPLWVQLRYTTPTEFLISRRGDVRRDGDDELFRAARLIRRALEFDGPAFSFGDAWIDERAQGRGSAGNYSVWRRVGTGHHLTKIVSLL